MKSKSKSVNCEIYRYDSQKLSSAFKKIECRRNDFLKTSETLISLEIQYIFTRRKYVAVSR